MEGQLVAGQWVEVAMEDLQTPVSLNGFVLSLRATDILLTFPELREPPEGLESEAHATLRYSNPSGHYTAIGHILRVAAGPPVTVTFKRLSPVGSDPRRSLVRTPVSLPVTLQVLSSSVLSPSPDEPATGRATNISTSGLLIATSRLLTVGDMVRLLVSAAHGKVTVQGRVVRVFENEDQEQGCFGVGIELSHENERERERWLEFAGEFQRATRR
jgi:hypothetical protein